MSDEPDYTTYSPEELDQVRRTIDRDRYPERYERVCEAIREREAGRPDQATSRVGGESEPAPIPWLPLTIAAVTALIVVVAGLVYVFGPSVSALNRELEPVVAAVVEAYPDLQAYVTIHGNISHEERQIVVLVPKPSWSETDGVGKREGAMDLARVALQAHPRPGAVTHVSIGFQSNAGVGPINVNETSIEYRFSRSELLR